MKVLRLVALLLVVHLGACALHDVQHDDPPVEPARPQPVERSAPPAAEQYVVKRGDTLYAIAWEQGLDYRDLAVWNHIASPYTIYPGQTVYLKAGLAPVQKSESVAASLPATQPSPEQSATSPATEPMPSPGRYQTDKATIAEPAQPEPQPAVPPKPVAKTDTAPPPQPVAESRPAPVPGTPLVWQWPTVGTVTSTFASGDSSRQGIDIRGREGQSVLAAAAGEVVYSGNGLIGYGELIIIKHDDTWLSAYGNNRRRRVNEGVRIHAGQPIAEMGPGNGDQAELHFEIRRKGKPVDPLHLLPRR